MVDEALRALGINMFGERVKAGGAAAVALTQQLVRLDSANPPGGEQNVTAVLAPLLEAAGFSVVAHEFAPGRPTLLAALGDRSDGSTLVFAGHSDTVPVGKMPWTSDPFGGDIADGRVYGRGSSDMKSGVAAFVTAAVAAADHVQPGRGITVVICAGEESGCEGSKAFAASAQLPVAGALVICEPTGNEVVLGHKGALWLRLVARGRAAHGSMPHLGDNAVTKLVRAVSRLDTLDLAVEPHGLLGPLTLNVGRFHGGENINSVPDEAVADIDIRTVPGPSHAALLAAVRRHLPSDVNVEATVDLPPVLTAADDRFVSEFLLATAEITGVSTPGAAATYFTDASVLTPAFGNPPTIVCGPGRADQAHQTDEFCEVEKIHEATALFTEVATRWCRS